MKIIAAIMGYCVSAALFFAPMSISLSTIFFIAALSTALLSVAVFSGLKGITNSNMFLPVVFMMVIPWAGLLYTEDLGLGLKLAAKTYYWLGFFALFSIQRVPAKRLLWAFISGVVLTAVVIFFQHAGALRLFEAKTEGFINPITFSLMLVFAMLCASFIFKETSSKKEKAFSAIAMLLLFANLLISKGRSGYLAFILTSPLILRNVTGLKMYKAASLALAMCAVLLLSPVVQSRISEAYNNIKQYKSMHAETSIGMRLHMWKGALNIIKEHPIAGVGTGGYKFEMRKYRTPEIIDKDFDQPHNTFLYMGASYGILGLALIVWLFYSALKTAYEYRFVYEGFALLSFVLIMLAGSLTDTQIIQGQSAMMLSIFMGMAARMPIHVKIQ